MIKINLLPQEMAGSRSAGAGAASAGSALVALVLLLAIGVNGALIGTLYYLHQNAQRALAEATRRERESAQALKETKVEFDEVSLNLERMQQLIGVAERLDPEDRLLWCRKLNALPLLVPQGVYLTELNVTQKVLEQETEESLKKRNEWSKTRKGPMPAVEKAFIISQTMNLTGVAYIENASPNERLEQVNSFYRNLQYRKVKLPFDQEVSSFIDGFVPLITVSSPVAGNTLEGREVLNFRFTLNTKPVTLN